MSQRIYTATLSTTSGGADTAYPAFGTDDATEGMPITGQLHAVGIVVGTLDTGTDITLVDETTGITLLTLTNVAASAIYYPRVGVHDNAGAAIAGAYTAPVLFGARLTVTVAQGGALKTGTLYCVVDEG